MKQQEAMTLRELINLCITKLFPLDFNVYDIDTEMRLYRIANFMDCPIDTILPDSTEPGNIAVYINASNLFETSEELKKFIKSENKKFEDEMNLRSLLKE